jgi:hypothetical protein
VAETQRRLTDAARLRDGSRAVVDRLDTELRNLLDRDGPSLLSLMDVRLEQDREAALDALAAFGSARLTLDSDLRLRAALVGDRRGGLKGIQRDGLSPDLARLRRELEASPDAEPEVAGDDADD